jgi:hypothetical protein
MEKHLEAIGSQKKKKQTSSIAGCLETQGVAINKIAFPKGHPELAFAQADGKKQSPMAREQEGLAGRREKMAAGGRKEKKASGEAQERSAASAQKKAVQASKTRKSSGNLRSQMVVKKRD